MRNLLLITLGASFALAIGAQGQLSGTVQFDFTAAQLAVWDLSGHYSRTDSTATATNSAEQTLSHTPDGKITGSGGAAVQNSSSDIHASETTTGRVTGGAGKPVLLSAGGDGTFGGKVRGINVSGKFSGSLEMFVDSTNRVVAGRETASFCVTGRGCQTVSTNSSFALQPNMDGSWSLALTVGTTNNVVSGTAVATLSNGRTVNFTVRGKYSSATQTSKLRLSGDGAAFSIVVNAFEELESLRGKFFGQKVAL